MTYFPPAHDEPGGRHDTRGAGFIRAARRRRSHAAECETPWARDLARWSPATSRNTAVNRDARPGATSRPGPNGLVLRGGRIVAEWARRRGPT